MRKELLMRGLRRGCWEGEKRMVSKADVPGPADALCARACWVGFGISSRLCHLLKWESSGIKNLVLNMSSSCAKFEGESSRQLAA